ncbi:hypothetical protein SAMN05216198_1957 [Halopseudomonas litoralis]|uniref:Asparagine synthase n=1 Tax=Halopseudomonas litoralis TaxID=797277 RepID=A0A1H1S891_9GAMM|nr:hypothetical protein [Halopseudomonas litoralis]SDS44172.1 hypothetical protein SAMN05216198_1957 [Halopseudomonas litoralis]
MVLPDEMIKVKVDEYLSFGYTLPELIEYSVKYDCSNNELSVEDWYKEINAVLNTVYDRIFAELPNHAKCVVPISGGWDSRALLAEAVERLGADRVTTVTFGTPGQFDYDIGNYIGETFNTNHTAINLNYTRLSFSELVKSAKNSSWTYMPDAYFNKLARCAVCERDDLVLSGFMGDPTTGSFLNKKNNALDGTILSFMKTQVRGRAISKDTFKRIRGVEIVSDAEVDSLSLYFNIRQKSCILPIISGNSPRYQWTESLPSCGSTQAKIFSPFSSAEWIELWSRVPRKLKENQNLYLGYLNYQYPSFFSLPSKYSYGIHKRRFIRKFFRLSFLGSKYLVDKVFGKNRFFYENLNYINYDTAFINRDDYRDLLKESFHIVSEFMGIDNDFDRLYREHCRDRLSHSEFFLLVIGAAVNIRAEAEVEK